MKIEKSTPILCVIRGAPACGKSTVSHALKNLALSRGLTVSYLSWDFFHHLVPCLGSLSRSRIISDTKRIIEVARACIGESVDLIILDGVYVYPEEIKEIKAIENYGAKVSFCKLYCAEETQIYRNGNRAPEDFLDPARLREVNQEIFWQIPIPNELELNTEVATSETTALQILSYLENLRSEDALQNKTFDVWDHPTLTNMWQSGTNLRFPISCRFNVNNFYRKLEGSKEVIWESFSSFDFDPDIGFENDLMERLMAGKINFKYLNLNGSGFNILKDIADRRRIVFKQMYTWMAPRLILNKASSFDSYLANRPVRLQRTIKKLLTEKDNLRVEFPSEPNAVLQLWLEALKIDGGSWKKSKSSDMVSLSREDLQYLPGLLLSPLNYSLAICYLNETIHSYSLMVRKAPGYAWYAVKWGCSDIGRLKFVGISCLLAHIEKLFNDGTCEFDFWGRDNEFYNQLATEFQARAHVEMSLEESQQG
jgi:adenylylsulfate kinase-like enzyme